MVHEDRPTPVAGQLQICIHKQTNYQEQMENMGTSSTKKSKSFHYYNWNNNKTVCEQSANK